MSARPFPAERDADDTVLTGRLARAGSVRAVRRAAPTAGRSWRPGERDRVELLQG